MSPAPTQPADDEEPGSAKNPLVPEQVASPKTDAACWDDVEAVRRESDPVRQAARATELINECGQRVTELAALRRAAIERAHHEHGLTYTNVADSLGLTKGRITQIRNGHIQN